MVIEEREWVKDAIARSQAAGSKCLELVRQGHAWQLPPQPPYYLELLDGPRDFESLNGEEECLALRVWDYRFVFPVDGHRYTVRLYDWHWSQAGKYHHGRQKYLDHREAGAALRVSLKDRGAHDLLEAWANRWEHAWSDPNAVWSIGSR